MKYTFSGHESFFCKSLWLKKGYDFVTAQNDFRAADAVVRLGVGKNMVSSIRYWLRAFGLTVDDKPTSIAHYLLDTQAGKDPYLEDLGTLWLLHYLLVSSGEATLYRIVFGRLARELTTFDRDRVIDLVRRMMADEGKSGQLNQTTLGKDFSVLLQMYIMPRSAKTFEAYSALLIDLDLLRTDEDGHRYSFNRNGKRQVPPDIYLFALINSYGDAKTIDYDLLRKAGQVFCMDDMEIITMCRSLEQRYKNYLRYSETAGIRQLQLLSSLSPSQVLDRYYGS